MNELAAQAYKIKVQLKILEAQYDSIMDRLKASGKTDFGPYRLTITTRPGSVDYSSIPQLSGVVLEPYRKPDVTMYKLEYLGEP